LLIIVELLNAQLGTLGLVEVLIDDFGLGLAEADEVDHIREDLDEALVRRLVQIVESEVVNAALEL
jgi:EAL domain-containing protein (putative c-di-GMP-specific phosphodiesterase class I)